MGARRKNLITGLLVGAALGLVHNTIPGDGTAGTQIVLFYVVLFPLAVVLISRPLLSYRQSIATAIVAICGWTVVKFITAAVAPEYPGTAQMMWVFWGVYGSIGLVANIISVGLATWLRRRLYPVYPGGHCQKCGYDLTGNISGVCPECGTRL